MKTFSEFRKELNESGLSRLWKKYHECDSGTISAFRGERSKKENMEMSKKLSAALIGAGYSVTSVDGVYIENYNTPDAKKVKEKSFIVFDYKKSGNLKKDLMKLGEKFDQDSITFNSVEDGVYSLIGTSKRDNSYPGYKKEVKLGKPMFGKNGEFFSTVNGRPFVFEDVISEEYHDFDDTLLNYNTLHKQVLVREAREMLADEGEV